MYILVNDKGSKLKDWESGREIIFLPEEKIC